MVAEAIGLALERAGIEVVARATTVATALTDTRRARPDIVLLDRRLPDGDGTTLIPELVKGGARVLVLTGEATASVAARVAEAGAAGLILKSARLDELVEAVRRVADGEVVFDPKLLAGVLDRLTGRVRIAGTTLTAREQETLLLLADGAGTEQISSRLGVARNTARNHVQRVLDKLGARSKLEAVSIARREGLLD
ncbi:LuxR family two component transcriptional regulator [Lentzea atacamensis]|uniref:DNA-binding NarL/FixJ family response regulator n=2 Tax=Pseudonocardiaceae TaxID=2070 RepID=A0A316HLR3_9PSEU|nr:LuxR family two component transcriptional regulator [Lentzea atacamensis]RAS66761.1 DNA-binding NarL/FixJ family response regulator [Lentzea atacamensis]